MAHHHSRSGVARATELLIKAATNAPYEGRPMYAALRAIPIPHDVVPRLFHAASLLREHRGDGHVTALMSQGIDGMRNRALIGDDRWLSERGRAVKQRVEALTDELAAKPYESLGPDELDELMALLEPLAALLLAALD